MTDQSHNLFGLNQSQATTSCIKFNAPPTEEVLRLDKEGFHYKGEFIADAGEAHRLMVAFLKQNTAKPEPVAPTDEEIEQEALKNADSDDEYRAFKSGAFFVQERISRPAIEPVPVSERPWDRNGWCDENGWCWGFDADDSDTYWVFDDPASCPCWTHLLPHHALPVPQQEVLPND